jgi:hypothetical protein
MRSAANIVWQSSRLQGRQELLQLEGDRVFKRLWEFHDSIVLPSAFEIVSCSVAAQVLREADGRLMAFVNPGAVVIEVTI